MNTYDLELRELRLLAAIASEGSFAKAARTLHISQPALSRSVQEAERKVGFRIFDRGRAGATPTDTGRMLLRHANIVMATAMDLQRELALIRGVGTGALRIGTGVFPPDLFLGPAMARLLQPGAGIQLRMVGGGAPDLLMSLRKRELDLVVADPDWLEESTDVKALAVSQHEAHLLVRSGHPILANPCPSLDEVVAYPLVTSGTVPPRIARMAPPPKSSYASMQARFCRWIPSIYTDSITLMKDAVRRSDAVTLLSLYLARHELERGELQVVPIKLPWIKVRFSVMYLSHRTLSPLAEALIAAIKSAATAQQEEEQRLQDRWAPQIKARRRMRDAFT